MKNSTKKYWLLIGIPIVLTLLLLGGRFFLYDFTARQIGKLLFEIVQLSDKNSPYRFENQKISFYPFERQLLIEGLEVYPKQNSSDSMITQYSFVLPEFFIDISSLTDIYFKQKLSISGISISSPTVKVVKTTRGKDVIKKPVAIEANDLYNKISLYLNKLDVKSFELKNGSVEFITDSVDVFEIENFSLEISNFSMDSSNYKTNKNIFYTENVLLQISNQSFQLEDENHRAHFDSLVFSSRDSTFRVFNFRFRNIDHPDKQDSVNIPVISFTGIDFDAFYKRRVIDLGFINLQDPYIHIHPTAKFTAGRKSSTPLNSLRYQIQIDSIGIKNGSLSYLDDKRTIKAEKLNLFHGAYHIEPQGELFVLDEFMKNITLFGEQLVVNSPGLIFTADSVNLEGKDEDFELYDMKAEFISDNSDILIEGPYARIKEYDIIGKSFLFIDSAWVRDPKATVLINKLQKSGEKSKFHVGINYLNLASGTMQGKIDTVDFEVTGINSIANKVSDTLGLRNLQRLKFLIEEIAYETPNDKATVTNWAYNGLTNNLTTDRIITRFGSVKGLKVFNPLIDRLSEKHYQFDSLQVENADLIFYSRNDTTKGSNVLQQIIYDKIRITDSRVRVRGKNSNIDLKNLDFEVGANSLVKNLSLSFFKLDRTDLSISSKSGYYLDSAKVFTLRNIDLSDKKNLKLRIDSVSLVGLADSIFLNETDSLLSKIKRIQIFQPNLEMKATEKPPGDKTRTLRLPQLPGIDVFGGKIRLALQESNLEAESIDFSVAPGIEGKRYFTGLNESSFSARNMFFRTTKDTFSLDRLEYSNYYLSLYHLNGGASPSAEFTMDTIKLASPDFERFLEKKEISLESIRINSGKLAYDPRIQKDSSKTDKKLPFTSLELGFARLQDIDILYELPDQQLALDSLQIDLQDINWTPGDSLRKLLERSRITVEGPRLDYRWFAKKRDISTGNFKYDDNEKSLTISNLSSEPYISKDSFMVNQETETDWIKVDGGQFALEDFELRSLIFNKKFDVSKISLTGFEVLVYRDKRLPDPYKYKSLPHSLLPKSPIELDIDTVFINSPKITYTAKNNVSDTLASIFFSNINGYLLNVYSDTARIRNSPKTKLIATGDIMKDGFFETTVTFEALDTLGRFEMEGKVGEMDLTQLNPILENSAQISVVSGFNELITFDFTANNNYAVGQMKFYYDNLKITVFNRENQPKGLTAGFKTFFANTFVVNKRNPHFLFIRKGNIFFERAKERSIINYWAKSLLSGVVTSIGARNNKKEIRQLNEESKRQLQRKKSVD